VDVFLDKFHDGLAGYGDLRLGRTRRNENNISCPKVGKELKVRGVVGSHH
jgi:hypothetical protein